MSPSRSSTYSIMRAQASPEASALDVPYGQWVLPNGATCTAPATSGAAGPERNSVSPDSAAAPMPAPWKASQKDSVLQRPVAARAILTATSTASEPPVVNSTLAGPKGEMSESLRASAMAGSQA